MNEREAAIIGAYTQILMGEFSDLHAYIEEVMGRPVFTHEIGDPNILAEIKEKCKPDFLAICGSVNDNFTQVPKSIHPLSDTHRPGVIELLAYPPDVHSSEDPADFYEDWWGQLVEAANEN